MKKKEQKKIKKQAEKIIKKFKIVNDKLQETKLK